MLRFEPVEPACKLTANQRQIARRILLGFGGEFPRENDHENIPGITVQTDAISGPEDPLKRSDEMVQESGIPPERIQVYFAARYSRRDQLIAYRDQLRTLGIECTSRWLDGNHELDDRGLSIQAADSERARFACEDFDDVCKANVVISFTEVPRTTATRGGRHVEFGVALALSKTCIVIGPCENVFHHLPGVIRFDEWPGEARLVEAIAAAWESEVAY